MSNLNDETGDLSCEEFVDMITAYLDGALPASLQSSVLQHLDGCEGCRNALAQWRTVIELTGQLTESDIERAEPLARDRLLSTFRNVRRR